MATIQGEILNIAKANGYEGDAPKTIAGAVNALGSVMGGGGSGGGTEPFVVTFTESGSSVTADKTFTEISAAVRDGKPVFGMKPGVLSYGIEHYQLMPMNDFSDVDGETQRACFYGFIDNGMRITIIIITPVSQSADIVTKSTMTTGFSS